jgi:GNAT superfamily N-acetyltransferase
VADAGDAERIASLSGELGYPAGVADVAARLRRLEKSDRDCVFVAVTGERLIGWIHAARRELLESDPGCEILGLVVDRAARRRGTGRSLLSAAERWARRRNLTVITVRSNVTRQESHPFYEQLGFARTKTQHVYRKPLAAERR